MALLALYWKHLVAVVLLGYAGYALYQQGGKSARLECAEAQLEARDAADKAIADAQAEANEANEALREELAKPPAAGKIREIVRENPSDCVLPSPVGDGLLEAIRSANESAR